MRELFSYTLPRPFYNYNIPISFQSTIIREYSKKNNFNFSLPVTELVQKDSYFMLSNIFLSKKNITDFAVVSGLVFPLYDLNILNKIFKNYKSIKKLNFHLILESKIFNFDELILWCSDINLKKKLIKKF